MVAVISLSLRRDRENSSNSTGLSRDLLSLTRAWTLVWASWALASRRPKNISSFPSNRWSENIGRYFYLSGSKAHEKKREAPGHLTEGNGDKPRVFSDRSTVNRFIRM